MELRIRSTVLIVEPSDASGFHVTLEVADAEELREQLLRGPDDGADDWPLAKRYGEICDRSRALVADLARVTDERDTLASEPEFRCPECGSFDVSEYHYKDDFASMECSGCRYRGQPGEDFPSATRLIAQSKENVWLREALEFYAGATSLNAVSTLLTDLGDRARKALAREASGE